MANSAAALHRQQELGTATSPLRVVVDHLPSSVTVDSPLNRLIKKAIAKGSIAEIYGSRSSGRTALCLHVLAQSTSRGEVCAVVDLHNSFHPASAQAAGAYLEQIVWVRCAGNAQHAMRAADLLLHAGGFGAVLLDLGEASPQALHRIPISYWYRLRRAIEHKPTALLVCSDSSEVKCSSVNKLALKRKAEHWSGKEPFLRFEGLETSATSSKALSAPPESLYLSSVA